MESQVRDSKRKEITDSEDSSSSSEGDVREVKSKKGAKKSTCEKKKRNKNETAPDKSTDVLCSKMIGPVLPSTMIGPSLPPSLEKTSRTIIGPVMPELKTSTESSKSIDLNKQRNFTPMTKEEWEKRQSVVRRVYDEDTGRERLVKGDGEIIEEIVSKNRQKEINRQATLGDGASFQTALSSEMKRKNL